MQMKTDIAAKSAGKKAAGGKKAQNLRLFLNGYYSD
jgi:hypothetical protein